MDIATTIGSIITAITSGLGELITKIPAAIKDAFMALFFDSTTTGGATTYALSGFAGVMFGLMGVSLAFGLTKLVYHLISSKIGA